MSKRKVAVIFGGRSGEHDVSLRSAESVIGALDRDKYDVVPIGIQRDGAWITGANAMAYLRDGVGDVSGAALLAGSNSAELLAIDANRFDSVANIDVALPILHGTYGEDGTVQGLLELANVPYVGAGVVGSAVGMDKAIFKRVMEAVGLPVLPWQLVLRSSWHADSEAVLDQLEATLSYPMFTKPANLGSSVGITKCDNRTELAIGMTEAVSFDRRVVVEQGINPRELEVSVLGNDNPVASVVGEIRPKRDFYDYTAKYISDDSDLMIPAAIDEALSDEIRRLACFAYQAIDCAGLARVDFLLDRATGNIYMNEINTLPGFTSISMYPKLWAASGLSYSDLLDCLIDLALARYAEKLATQTSNRLQTTTES